MILRRSILMAVIACFLVAAPAPAQVTGQLTLHTSDPFDYTDDYVDVGFVGQWDTTVWCGLDGGCMEVWCDADDAEITMWSDWTYQTCPGAGCYGPDPGDGYAGIGVYDYAAPSVMEDQLYEGVMDVHWANGIWEYGDSAYESLPVQAAAIPINFGLVLQEESPHGVGEADLPGLENTYAWDPSGSYGYNALVGCEVWEVLTFDGDTPSNSTFHYGSASPTQNRLAYAQDAELMDPHYTQGQLGEQSGIDNAHYWVIQTYRWKCRGGPLTDFLTGSTQGPHNVDREVKDSGSIKVFEVRKHGEMAGCQLRTSGQGMGWCHQ